MANDKKPWQPAEQPSEPLDLYAAHLSFQQHLQNRKWEEKNFTTLAHNSANNNVLCIFLAYDF